jgi:hypothetical protein
MTPYDGSKAKREMQLEAPQLPSPLQGGIALTFGLASAPAAALRSSSSSLAELPLLAVPGLRFSLYGTAMGGRDISKSRASRAPGEIGEIDDEIWNPDRRTSFASLRQARLHDGLNDAGC